MIKSTLKNSRYCPLVIQGFSNFLGLFQGIMANPVCQHIYVMILPSYMSIITCNTLWGFRRKPGLNGSPYHWWVKSGLPTQMFFHLETVDKMRWFVRVNPTLWRICLTGLKSNVSNIWIWNNRFLSTRIIIPGISTWDWNIWIGVFNSSVFCCMGNCLLDDCGFLVFFAAWVIAPTTGTREEWRFDEIWFRWFPFLFRGEGFRWTVHVSGFLGKRKRVHDNFVFPGKTCLGIWRKGSSWRSCPLVNQPLAGKSPIRVVFPLGDL